MDFEHVLASLQAQFEGQMVLYPGDLAKILGKSERSIQHLMKRSHLPFQIKFVGQARCVDIFQVAKWLSSDAAMAMEVADAQAAPRGSKGLRTSPQIARTGPSLAVAHGEGQGERATKKLPRNDEAYGPFARMILERRKADALRLQGFALGLSERDNLAFMLEVLDAFVLGSTHVQSTYLVTLGNLSPKVPGLWASSSKRYFDDERAAADFAHERLTDLQKGRVAAGTQIKIEINDEIIFWCAHCKESGIVVISNAMELPLPEIDQ